MKICNLWNGNPWFQKWNLCGKLCQLQGWIHYLTIDEDDICNLATNDNYTWPWNPSQNFFLTPPPISSQLIPVSSHLIYIISICKNDHLISHILYIYIKLLLERRCTAPGGSIKTHSPNLTANTNIESKKMWGWTTSDIKKIKNLIKTFWSETFFSYLQLLNKKEL